MFTFLATMFVLVDGLSKTANAVIITAAVMTAIAAMWKGGGVLWRRGAGVYRRTEAMGDVLLGREAILHPETGEVVVEATPGLGVRLATMETAIAAVADSRIEMAALTIEVRELAHKVDVAADDRAALWSHLRASVGQPPIEGL